MAIITGKDLVHVVVPTMMVASDTLSDGAPETIFDGIPPSPVDINGWRKCPWIQKSMDWTELSKYCKLSYQQYVIGNHIDWNDKSLKYIADMDHRIVYYAHSNNSTYIVKLIVPDHSIHLEREDESRFFANQRSLLWSEIDWNAFNVITL